MTTPLSCPNCGSQLAPGVAACARCGERFVPEEPEYEPQSRSPARTMAPPKPSPPARIIPSASRSRSAVHPEASGISIRTLLADTCERWGLDATPFFYGCLGLAGIAFLLATVVMVSYLTSDALALSRHFHDGVWLDTAAALALGALVLAVVVRHDALSLPVSPSTQSIDFRIGSTLAGLVVIFSIICAVVGWDGRFVAQDAWARYAAVFAFLAATWFALSQPVPEKIGSADARTAGLVIGGVALVLLAFGQMRSLSNSPDTYPGGVAIQAFGISLLVLALGWFLGRQPRASS